MQRQFLYKLNIKINEIQVTRHVIDTSNVTPHMYH